MRNLFILMALSAISLNGIAQKSKLTTAILSRDADQFEKAKTNIDEVVLHEKTISDPKAWFYKGLIYQNLAQIQLGSYLFNPINNVGEDQIEVFKGLTENAINVSFEAYKKCIELDEKNRYKRKVDDNLKNVLAFSAFNMGGLKFQDGVNTGMDKDLLMQAYENYNTMYNMMDVMTPTAASVFTKNLTESAALEDLNLVRFNMANAAFNAEEFKIAQKEYEKLVEEKLPELYVYRNLAYIYKKQENEDAQRKLYTKALESFDGSTEIGRAIAIDEAAFYQEIGELETLISKLENAISLDPTNASLYNVLGGIYAEKCVSHNNAIIDEDADQTKKLEDGLYKEYFDKSAELLRKAQELAPNEATNYTQVGRLYLSEGSVHYNQNQNLGTSKSDLAKSKVLSEKYKVEFGKAINELERGLAVEPENIETLELLALVNLWNGNYEKNIEYKNKIKELTAK